MIGTKVIQSRILPPKGYVAITLFGLIFTRDKNRITAYVKNHELIHCQQQLEWLYLPFYIVYFVEWVWHLIRLGNWNKAYRAISFEKEAYAHEKDLDYPKTRKMYANFRKN